MLKKGLLFLAIVAVALYLAWTVSPWPSALVYRALFDRDGVAMNEALARHVPENVAAQVNLPYAPGDPDGLLDVYRPTAMEGRALPAIVWVHGGAFLSGSKDQVTNYLRILAGKGYVAVGVDYSLAPGAHYPVPVLQVNAALRFLERNAGRFGIDATKFVLAGDSAGAQIAAQVTALISSPVYAARLNIVPPIEREQLRGSVLFCGLHDPDALNTAGSLGGFLRTATWSYFGVKELAGDPRARDFSIVENITSTFPPLFISAGNADPLLRHSQRLAEAAAAKGVAVDSLFFAEGYAPGLPHEYQFNLDNEAGRLALERMLAFLAAHLG